MQVQEDSRSRRFEVDGKVRGEDRVDRGHLGADRRPDGANISDSTVQIGRLGVFAHACRESGRPALQQPGKLS